MQPDILFIASGATAAGVAVALLPPARKRFWRRRWLPVLLWACLGAGFLVQGFAPHLRIERNRFILSLPADARVEVDPAARVERERRMQLLSGLLTVSATMGLAFCYRDRFAGAKRERSLQ